MSDKRMVNGVEYGEIEKALKEGSMVINGPPQFVKLFDWCMMIQERVERLEKSKVDKVILLENN